MDFEESTEKVVVDGSRYRRYFGTIAAVIYLLSILVLFVLIPICPWIIVTSLLHYFVVLMVFFPVVIGLSVVENIKSPTIEVIIPKDRAAFHQGKRMLLKSGLVIIGITVLLLLILIAVGLYTANTGLLFTIAIYCFVLIHSAMIVLYCLVASFLLLYGWRKYWVERNPEVLVK